MSNLIILIRYNLMQVLYKKGAFYVPVIFFFSSIFIFPFTVNPEKEILSKLITTIILISSFFAIILSTNEAFNDDTEDGTIDQLILAGIKGREIFLSKFIISIILTTIPILLSSFLLYIFFDLTREYLVKLLLTISLSNLITTNIGLLASLITRNLANSAQLSCLISIPLSIATMIFASTILNSPIEDTYSYFKLLLGVFIILTSISLWLANIIVVKN